LLIWPGGERLAIDQILPSEIATAPAPYPGTTVTTKFAPILSTCFTVETRRIM
jgi:hypothetical protein